MDIGRKHLVRVGLMSLISIILVGGFVLGLNYFLADRSLQLGDSIHNEGLDTAIGEAVKSRITNYAEGEVATEGHLILGVEDNKAPIKVYTLASYGAFAFENGVFTKVSGSGSIPTVITLKPETNGGYTLLAYKEPMDGAGYFDSLKKMFPTRLRDKVRSADQYYTELARQQEDQAAEYLNFIGRKAKVSASHVEKKLADINVQASNKLFGEFTKYDSFLNQCPYWLGTRETLENGQRYLYETSQSKTSDGYDLMTFKKVRADGTLIEEVKYKIVGSEPQEIN